MDYTLSISIDYIKSHTRRDAFILHCPEFVIVDEAHGCAKPAGQSVSQQQRHQLIYDLAQKESRYLIMTTATPHSGVEDPFLSLLGFIRQDFGQINMENLQPEKRVELAKYFIQRRRADVKDWLGTTQFPDREPLEVSFGLSAEYKQLFEDVYKFAREFVSSSDTQSGFRRRVRYWAALALLRCVMSSPEAAKIALLARIKPGDLGDQETTEQDYYPEVFDTTEQDKATDVVPTNVIQEGETTFPENEKRKLREFAKRAESLTGESDTKIKKASEEIRKIIREGNQPIVFCRFIATANYVADELKKNLGREFPDLHIMAVTGEKSEDEREILVSDLCKSRRRVLVATDCLSEGVNLQEGFNAVLHYDLPWNPNRLEQREGRVDRFGQIARVVKTILLYGADNPIDGAVLNVLLRKAREIHKSLGITVPLPVDSESVMEAVLKALFLHSEDGTQLALFNEAPVIEVHRKWDRSAEKEKKSRTLFAQHAIKPDEIVKELEATDSVLGDPQTVARFINNSCVRLGSPLYNSLSYKTLDLTRLPEEIRMRTDLGQVAEIAFEQPEPKGVLFIHRNHVLTNVIAEYLFNESLDNTRKNRIVTRCGVIRSKEVNELTTLLLLRLRFLIKDPGEETGSMAEECMITGFRESSGTRYWFSKEEAELLYQKALPSANLTEDEKIHWANIVLNGFSKIKPELNALVEKRSASLAESYEHLRKTIKTGKVQVSPILPPDVLTVSIIVPVPKV
ncbi:MAG: DEAD/DEAH box helicase [Dehalococcoidales bacterium]|nr:DEAD/DEAH box helicase [Dehalococcoidales bacterium]